MGHPNKVRTILITQIMNDLDITIFSPAAECREWNGAYWFSLDDLNEQVEENVFDVYFLEYGGKMMET